jgi:hypothetical protein
LQSGGSGIVSNAERIRRARLALTRDAAVNGERYAIGLRPATVEP